MKKIMMLIIAGILITCMCVNFCFAAPLSDISAEHKNILFYDDGGYIIIQIEETVSDQANEKSTNELKTKSGAVTYTKKSNSGTVLWVAVLNGTFTYDGFSSNCISASCNVTFYDSHYSLTSNNATAAGNTAIGVITIAYKILGITISTETHTLTLSCDSNGNLS